MLNRYSLFAAIITMVGATYTYTYADDKPATPPPAKIETLFQHARYGHTMLSPDGKKLATAARVGKRFGLIVIDLDTNKTTPVAGFSDADITWFTWINDHRIVFSIIDMHVGLADQLGGGLYAVEADGSIMRTIMPTIEAQANSGAYVGKYQWDDYLDHYKGTDDIVVGEQYIDEFGVQKGFNPIRINTRKLTRTSEGVGLKGRVTDIVTDWTGMPRTAEAIDGDGNAAIWYRAPGQDNWAKLTESSTSYDKDLIEPVGFAPDGSLNMVASQADRNTRALFAYDPAKRAIGKLLYEDSDGGANMGDPLYDKTDGHLLGVHTNSDAPRIKWIDADWAKLQDSVDAALPGNVNDLQGDVHGRVLVRSYSEREPGRYYLYDAKTHKLQEELALRPDIDPEQLAETKILHYKTRDGLRLMAYLTLPPGREAKKLPLIVLPHGGPYLRDEWGFNPEVQFLATRGYAVVQPQFRGSTGFGSRLFTEGWKTWGLAMQDDLTDAVKGLADADLIDAKRVCIMGASYGGYAALMGVVKDPDQYRCAIAFAAVSDIDLMFTAYGSDFSSSLWADFGMKMLVGDPAKLKDQFAATSPARQAARIKAPVLLVHATDDHRVPLEHGLVMRNALAAAHKVYEWHEITDEAHGLMKEENRYAYYHWVEDFLAKYNPSDVTHTN